MCIHTRTHTHTHTHTHITAYTHMHIHIYRGNQLLWGYDESMDLEIQYICIYV